MEKNFDVAEFRTLIEDGLTIPQLMEHYDRGRTWVTSRKQKYGLVGLSPNVAQRVVVDGEKRCNACELWLPLDRFYSNGYYPSGTQKFKPKCKVCDQGARRARFYSLLQEHCKKRGMQYMCQQCGYCKNHAALEWHHVDGEKDFAISNVTLSIGVNAFEKDVVPELDRCVLLCANCHRERHNRLLEI